MHSKGVIHRDMNPTNVFLDEKDLKGIKILDFNVSKKIRISEKRKDSIMGNIDEELKIADEDLEE